MSTEIGTAYISVMTRMTGVKKDLENALDDVDGVDAGGKIADNVGKGISTKQAAIAGAFGGIFASIANLGITALGNAIGDAVQQSDAIDKFRTSLDFTGVDSSKIDELTASTRAYADATVYSLSDIQSITSNLAGAGVKGFDTLAESLGNFNAAAGGSADTYGRLGLAMSQINGTGVLKAEDWNQITDAVGGSSVAIKNALEAAGAFTGNFKTAMSEGEISADEFNAAIQAIGSQPVAVEAARSVSTMEGAVGNLSAAITGNLADAFTAIKPFITAVISGFADFISNSEIFLPIIGGLATAIGVVLAPAIWTAATAVGSLTLALLTSPITWIILGITALVASIIWMAQNWDQVTAFVTTVWGGFIGWITGVIDGFVGWWNGIWAAVGAWITSVWNGIVSTVQGAWAGFVGWIMGAVAGFLGWWNGIWKALGDGWNALWDGFGSIVSGIWNGIINGIKGYINTLIGLINGVINGVNVLIGGAGAVIGLDLKIPNIPKLAQGGIVGASAGGTLAVIGEGGRDEAVIPLPNDWKQNGLGGGLRPGDRVIFEIEGTPLTAVAKRVVGQYDTQQTQAAARGYAGGI